MFRFHCDTQMLAELGVKHGCDPWYGSRQNMFAGSRVVLCTFGSDQTSGIVFEINLLWALVVSNFVGMSTMSFHDVMCATVIVRVNSSLQTPRLF